jgi:Xaa-Pro aminopeptidase
MPVTRVAKVRRIIKEMDLDACIVKGMDNIFYLSGFSGSEGLLLLSRRDTVLITDSRYTTYAREVTRGARIVETTAARNPLKTLCRRRGMKRLGFDSMHTTYELFARWQAMLKGVELIPLGSELEGIRKQKEPDEIAAIREAVAIATEAFTEVMERTRPGKTEKEVADDLEYTMKRLGAEKPSFDTIVASGPRAALPHARPTDREIRPGETVIIDWGAQVKGYCSDETCTVRVGSPEPRMEEVFSIVREAQKRGLDKIAAGTPIKEVDAVVRDYIAGAGYGGFFRHSTGHGVGIAVHEDPAINGSAAGVLEENMVVTIEPGIYIPHAGGVRLEDLVLVKPGGAEIMTRIDKDSVRISA